MTTPAPTAPDLEHRIASRLLDVLIRASLIGVMVVLCYEIFSPFLTLMAWALILAVSLYPLQQRMARAMGGKQGLAATILIIVSIVVMIVPTALLMSSLGDSVRGLITGVQNNTLQIPVPKETVKTLPIVGPKIYDYWTRAHNDLPELVLSLQPKVGDLARKALAFVAGIGLGILHFLGSLIIAGIMMAYGQLGHRSTRAIFVRVMGPVRGERFEHLSAATIRTVAQGILGVAFIKAIIIGLTLLVAGLPWAGALALIALVLAIAQLPTMLVRLPAIAYLWMSGHYGTASALVYTVILLLAGLIDTVLKPLLLGRGVDSPMPVVLLGALGGMASNGILGMFVGATLLTLGYQIFMGWVHVDDSAAPVPGSSPAPPAS
jgi:predicted PurR-regulated permease PerM